MLAAVAISAKRTEVNVMGAIIGAGDWTAAGLLQRSSFSQHTMFESGYFFFKSTLVISQRYQGMVEK
jgi:hypothetical protein